MKLRILKLHPDAKVPTYQSEGAACFDLYATTVDGNQCIGSTVTYGTPVVCGTGLAFEVPDGYVLEVHSRSGQGFNHDVRLANCEGQIDSDYRGEVMVKLTCDLNDATVDGPPYFVKPGDRIAQARLCPSPKVVFEVAEQLSITERGENGFGSSGRFPFCGCGDSDSLPERDKTKSAEQQGLFRKFVVHRTDGSDAPGGKHDGCDYFVLDVTHDTHAKAALAAYASAVEETHPQLAADMRVRYGLAAPQQAEAVPPDVVRDAAPIPDHELVTMYDERPTSDREMIEFAREVERRHGIGVQPQHITDGSPCWCNPDVAYTDPETGASVIVHRRPQ